MGRRSSPSAQMELSVSQLQASFGMDRATIQKRLDAAGADHRDGPRGAKLYRLHDAIRACLVDFLGSNEPGTYEEAKTREMKARAQIQELDLAVRRGQLLPAEEVGKIWADHITKACTRLDAVSTALAPVVKAETDEARCKVLIDRGIRDAIDEIRESADDYDVEEGGGQLEDATGSDGEPVGGPAPKAKRGSKR